MESTLDREKFLALMAQWGHASSATMVETVLGQMGWGDRQAFTKGDVVSVLEAVTNYAQAQIQSDPAAMTGATDEEKAHLSDLIGAVQQHAVPLLKKETVDEA